VVRGRQRLAEAGHDVLAGFRGQYFDPDRALERRGRVGQVAYLQPAGDVLKVADSLVDAVVVEVDGGASGSWSLLVTWIARRRRSRAPAAGDRGRLRVGVDDPDVRDGWRPGPATRIAAASRRATSGPPDRHRDEGQRHLGEHHVYCWSGSGDQSTGSTTLRWT